MAPRLSNLTKAEALARLDPKLQLLFFRDHRFYIHKPLVFDVVTYLPVTFTHYQENKRIMFLPLGKSYGDDDEKMFVQYALKNAETEDEMEETEAWMEGVEKDYLN